MKRLVLLFLLLGYAGAEGQTVTDVELQAAYCLGVATVQLKEEKEILRRRPSALHFIRGSATQAHREHDNRRRRSIRVVRLKGRQSRALARSRLMPVVPCMTSVVGMNAVGEHLAVVFANAPILHRSASRVR
jgi:hypothetical protein